MAAIPSLLAQIGIVGMPDFLVWVGIAWLALTQVVVLILIILVIIRILKYRLKIRQAHHLDQPTSDPSGLHTADTENKKSQHHQVSGR